MNSLAYQIEHPFEVEIKEQEISEKMVESYSSVSKFADDVWIIDKKYSDRLNGSRKLHFEKIPELLRGNVKEYDLSLFLQRLGFDTIYSRHQEVKRFYVYLNEKYGIDSDMKITAEMIFDYFSKVKNAGLSRNFVSARMRYIKDYYQWLGVAHINNIIINYDIPKQSHSTKDYKYISCEVAEQLDVLFYSNEDIPLEMRLFYWTLRLFPSRRNEVSSMRIDCLIYCNTNQYLLMIPTFKQEGQYVKGGVRKLGLYKEGILDFYINLLHNQIEKAQELQEETEKSKRGFLFSYEEVKWEPHTKRYIFTNHICILDGAKFNKKMKDIIGKYNIRDKEGNIVNVTSHQFRHNGITDRIQSGLFRAVDIMAITNSKSVAMINQAYVHVNNEQMREAVKTINEKVTGEEAVVFKGRVLPADTPQIEQRILTKPFAHRIGEIGICSDISKCESSMFECLNCPSFVPDNDSKEYFQEQMESWKKKYEIALNCGNGYLIDRAQRYIELNQKMIIKIEKEVR